MGDKRVLPRFEVVQVGPGRFCAFDHLTKVAKWAQYPASFTETQGVVELLAHLARQRGEALSLERTEHPTVKRRSDPKPKTKPE